MPGYITDYIYSTAFVLKISMVLGKGVPSMCSGW